MYAVYHLDLGLRRIAHDIHQRTRAAGQGTVGRCGSAMVLFDTLTVAAPGKAADVVAEAASSACTCTGRREHGRHQRGGGCHR